MPTLFIKPEERVLCSALNKLIWKCPIPERITAHKEEALHVWAEYWLGELRDGPEGIEGIRWVENEFVPTPSTRNPAFPNTLKLQKQPTDCTCVQTCLAMILGVPVEDVIAKFGGKGLGCQDLHAALNQCDVLHTPIAYSKLWISGYYLAVVPSLNTRGGNHQVIIHYHMGEMQVLDPSAGEAYKPDGSDLKSWESLIIFHPGGEL